MIPVDKATEIVLSNLIECKNTSLQLNQTIGGILKEPIIADRDFPPYNRITMDGIAILYAPYAEGQRSFSVADIAPAGSPQKTLLNPKDCIEVMTGAILPEGTDTVIRYEDVCIENGIAQINEPVVEGQNIHYQGEDRKKGSVVINAGRQISPAEIGVAATVGKAQLQVSKLPKAIIISTGDELVEIDEQPLAHQIRKSNVHRLQATLSKWGLETDRLHLMDDKNQIEVILEDVLKNYPIVVMSGGVSKGKFDFIPGALDALGVEKLFHKIQQRPGKPFWFGRSPKTGSVVFALPGNPVSSFMCVQRYMRPWLDASLGQSVARPFAILKEDVTFKPDLTYFMQVKIEYHTDGKIFAIPVHGHGSGDLANLVDADGFLELTQGKDFYKAGEVYPLWLYR